MKFIGKGPSGPNFHSVYFEYEEDSTHDRLLPLNYAFCHIKRLIKTSEPVYTD